MSTYVLTGTASGIGAATKARLEAGGHRVIGVDLQNADIDADLGTPAGRAAAIAAITDLADGPIDGFAPIAGVGPATGRPAGLLVAVNYFGAVELLAGLRPLLAQRETSSVVLVSSNSTTCQPGWPTELADACLTGDEAAACRLAESYGEFASMQAYPATKAALAYHARLNSGEYIKDGIRINAVAPGFIHTPLTDSSVDDPAVGAGMKEFLAGIPVGRGGRPEEIASLIAYLLRPESTFLVGSVLFADGGTDAALHAKDWPKMWEAGG